MSFNDVEEVKEYLERLGIEYRYGCYKEKNPETCHLLGDYFEIINRDNESAYKTFKANCDERDFGISCDRVGQYQILAKGGAKTDWFEIYDKFKKACHNGNVSSCDKIGILATKERNDENPYKRLNEEEGKPYPDPKEGIEYFQKACDQGFLHSCGKLASFYLHGNIVERNLEKGFSLSVRSCDEGKNPIACYNSYLSYFYGLQGLVDKDLGKAKEYLLKYKEILDEESDAKTSPRQDMTFGGEMD